MITSGELAQLQNEAKRLLTESCIVRSPGASISDGMGGFEPGPPIDSGPYVCMRRMPRDGAEMEQASQMNLVKPWVVLLPAGTQVDGDDRIIIGSDEYDVVGVMEGGTREIVRRVLVVEVTT